MMTQDILIVNNIKKEAIKDHYETQLQVINDEMTLNILHIISTSSRELNIHNWDLERINTNRTISNSTNSWEGQTSYNLRYVRALLEWSLDNVDCGPSVSMFTLLYSTWQLDLIDSVPGSRLT